MGQKEEAVARLVIDTNALGVGPAVPRTRGAPFGAWYAGRFRLAVSGDMLPEYERVLHYPRFRLTDEEAAGIMQQYVLPFCDRFEPTARPRVCSDQDDDKFFHCAAAARYLRSSRPSAGCQY